MEWAGADSPEDESGKEALDELAGILQRFGFDPLKTDIQPVIQYACWDHEHGELAQAWDAFRDELL